MRVEENTKRVNIVRREKVCLAMIRCGLRIMGIVITRFVLVVESSATYRKYYFPRWGRERLAVNVDRTKNEGGIE